MSVVSTSYLALRFHLLELMIEIAGRTVRYDVLRFCRELRKLTLRYELVRECSVSSQSNCFNDNMVDVHVWHCLQSPKVERVQENTPPGPRESIR